MTKITMELIKQLREKTHVGMMDCKNALIESEGDIEKAIEILRKKGADVAQKRADKETNHGNIEACLNKDSKSGALVKIGCETDFSANTKDMKDFALNVCNHILQATPECIGEGENCLLKQKIVSDEKMTVEDKLNELIAKIREKIEIKEFKRFQIKKFGIINFYIHPGANLGVLLELETDQAVEQNIKKIKQLALDICMQVAVTNPLCINPSQLDEKVLEKERSLIKEQLLEQGKPENIIDKITEGKMNKFYEQTCLLNQKFIKNDKLTVKNHINQISKDTGLKKEIKNFKRMSIGK